MTEPTWKHDCDRCVYLGQWYERLGPRGTLGARLTDLWWCAGDVLGPSLIMRWGNEGWEYASGSVSVIVRHSPESELRQALESLCMRGMVRITAVVDEEARVKELRY